MNQETIIQRQIMLALSEAGCLVFRNETAGAWVGKVIHKEGNLVTLANARMVTFGLCVGSSDIIGCDPEGRFIGAEVKTATGKPTPEQRNFIDNINRKGGIAGIVRSPLDALKLIGR